jgi:signal transduction histidine kinase
MGFIHNIQNRIIFLFLPFVMGALPILAQTSVVDSLRMKISKDRTPAQFELLSKITLEYLKIHLDSALVFSEKAYQLAKTLGQDSLIAKSAYRKSEVFLRKNKFPMSLEFAELALEKYTTISDTIGVIKALNMLGGIWLSRLNYPQAAKYFYQSLKLADRIGDKRSRAAINANLSFIEKENGNTGKAIAMLQEARDIVTELKDTRLLMTILNSLANLYDELKDCRKSIATRQALIKLSQAQKDKRMEAIATGNLAISYECDQQYDKIPETCEQAILLKKEAGLEVNISVEYIHLGDYYARAGNSNLALSYYQKAVGLLSAHNLLGDLADAHQKMSSLYEKRKEYAASLDHFKTYNLLKDSVLSLESLERIEEIKQQYETEAKEQQNALLTERNRELKSEQKIWLAVTLLFFSLLAILSWFYWQIRRQKTQISRQRDELAKNNHLKDRLYAIIAHDLRSPLITLVGLSKKVTFLLQRNRFEEIQQLGVSVETSVDNVHRLLDNLLNWAMVQSNRFPHYPELLRAEEVIQEVIAVYQHTAESKSIDLRYEVASDTLVFADRHALSTIVRNLVDNALKFTDSQGRVVVTAWSQGGEAVFCIKDTGQGLSPERLQPLFEVKGQKWERRPGEQGIGLGLPLCQELAAMNNGRIVAKSDPGNGSIFEVYLPISAS